MDLIERQAAIDAIDEIESEVADGDGFRYEKWRRYFCELPSAQPNLQPTSNQLATDVISRQAAIDEIRKCRFVVDAVEKISGLPSAQPELCEDSVSRADVLESFADLYDTFEDCSKGIINELHRKFEDLRTLPSVTQKAGQPEWNNHTVACLLAELFNDTCACNFSGIDEWLPEKCELLDSCPNPVGVACWEQYLKHRVERRTDE